MKLKLERIIALKLEHILSTAAVVISIAAFILSITQSCSTIRHYHVSLEPRLYVYFSNEEQRDRFGFYLINNGLRPAYLTDFQVYLDNQPVSPAAFGDFQSLLEKLNLNPLCFVWVYYAKGTALENGKEHFLIRARKPQADECSIDKLGLFYANRKRIKIVLAFESIYGDKFTYTYTPG